MKIKTIGTGALAGASKSFCTLIDDRILIDCGNGLVKEMIRQDVDICKIDYLLVTHMHADHYFDIPFLIIQRSIMNAMNKLTIILPEGGSKMIRDLTRFAFIDMYGNDDDYNNLLKNSNIFIKEIDEVNDYKLFDNYSLSSIKVIHGKLDNCFAYIIDDSKIKVGISGDSSYCDGINKLMKIVDIAILDMSFEKGSIWHMGLENINTLVEKYNKRIITNHMTDSVKNILIKKNIDNIIIPNDGDIFNF